MENRYRKQRLCVEFTLDQHSLTSIREFCFLKSIEVLERPTQKMRIQKKAYWAMWTMLQKEWFFLSPSKRTHWFQALEKENQLPEAMEVYTACEEMLRWAK